MRARHILIGGGTLAVLAALLMTDPDGGRSTGLGLLGLASGLVAVGAAHMSRKGLFDYLNLQRFAERAHESPIGAGLVFVGVCMVLSALLGLFGKAHAQVPDRAIPLLPILAEETARNWPEVPLRGYPPGLIEHESCISLTHSRCWAPTSQLRTQREEGAGLGQLTRAWRADGSLRFDSLAALREAHPALADLSWQTIYSRPDLQMRALLLMSRDNWQSLRFVSDPMQRLAMTDLAYNAGPGRVLQDRRACQVTPGCDPAQWWGHVERTCTASKAVIYGQRSACDISRHHVADVLRQRAPKYRGLV